jgi:hypothetical protein
MNRFQTAISTVTLIAASFSLTGCPAGGVGDPCIPEDEYQKQFSGYDKDEVNVEAMSFQCETRLCLVNHFQGRVSCPYGQTRTDPETGETVELSDAMACKVPDGSGDKIEVDVEPQLLERRAKEAVYCSCRCKGPDANARYCECPSGYKCTLLNEIPLGASQLLGSYCVRNGTAYSKTGLNLTLCSGTDCPYEGYPDGENPFTKTQ